MTDTDLHTQLALLILKPRSSIHQFLLSFNEIFSTLIETSRSRPSKNMFNTATAAHEGDAERTKGSLLLALSLARALKI